MHHWIDLVGPLLLRAICDKKHHWIDLVGPLLLWAVKVYFHFSSSRKSQVGGGRRDIASRVLFYVAYVAELSIAYATHVPNHCNVVPLGWFKSVKTTAPSTRNLQKRKGGVSNVEQCRAIDEWPDDEERRDDRHQR